MSKIRIGEILVHDLNDNNLYDAGDRISGPAGSHLSPKEIQVRVGHVLSGLQTSSLKGILLSDAASYLDSFKQAEQASQKGDPEETRWALSDAQDASKNLPIPFNQTRADLLMQQALSLNIPASFLKAQQIAQAGGEIPDVRDLLSEAEESVNELNLLYGGQWTFDRPRAESILQSAYVNGIPPLYGEADNLAQAGQIEAARFELARIQNFIQEGNQSFNLGLTYDVARADQIMQDAYIKGIPLLYSLADRTAQRGQTRRVRLILSGIQGHIQDANRSYNLGLIYNQIQGDTILGKALFFGVKDNFNLALRYARAGNLPQTQKWLMEAQNYVNEYNQNLGYNNSPSFITFDQSRAALITACAQGKGPCI